MMKRRYWLAAILAAALVHAAGFLIFTSHQDEGAKDQGEQGIEIDLGMLGELGEAKQSEEPELVEPEPIEEPEPIVEPEPEPEPLPEVKPEPVKQPEPVKPKQQTEVKVKKQVEKPKPKPMTKPDPEPVVEPVKTKPTPSSTTASKAETGQTSNKKQSTGSANAVSTGAQVAAKQSYFSMLAATLAKHKQYPVASRRRGEEGIVKLFFIVDRNGKVLDFRISESSGSRRLDEAVIKMLQKAQPLPPFPTDMVQPQLEVNVPIAFQLNMG
jgi:protein TonB